MTHFSQIEQQVQIYGGHSWALVWIYSTKHPSFLISKLTPLYDLSDMAW